MKKKEKSVVIQRIVQAYLSSVISVTLVLSLIGLVGILIINAQRFTSYFKENLVLSVVLKENISEADALMTKKSMESLPYVKELIYISQAQGTKEMAAMLGEDFLEIFTYNPVPVSVELKLLAKYVKEEELELIQKKLLEMDDVREVFYQKSILALVTKNLEKIGFALLIFIGLLLFVSVVLINNTVRLSVYARRFTIHAMRLVGATKGFIRRPFMIQAFFQGLISSLLAVLLLIGGLVLVQKELTGIYQIIDYQLLALVFGAIVLLGIFLCMLSTHLVVNKMVRMDSGALYY